MFIDILLRHNDQRMRKYDTLIFGHIYDQKITRRISQKKNKKYKKNVQKLKNDNYKIYSYFCQKKTIKNW
jgi:hypothetical protein